MTGSEQNNRPAPGGRRAARLAAALKANMARRKAQAALRGGATVSGQDTGHVPDDVTGRDPAGPADAPQDPDLAEPDLANPDTQARPRPKGQG